MVINTQAGREFSRRTGLPYRVIPNVMDFAHPPAVPDEYAQDFRQAIGLSDDDFMILQPTRLVQRKGIEHSIQLVHYLDDPRCRLVMTHESNDEGPAYQNHICRFAKLLGVELIFAESRIAAQRGEAADGSKQYAIWDVYPHADLVAYPSTYEGFGNAFLEAVYYKKPIFSNRYTIYRTDIEPYGFRAAAMDGFIDKEVVENVRRLLTDEEQRNEMVESNYQLARQHFSYERLEDELRSALAHIQPSPN